MILVLRKFFVRLVSLIHPATARISLCVKIGRFDKYDVKPLDSSISSATCIDVFNW